MFKHSNNQRNASYIFLSNRVAAIKKNSDIQYYKVCEYKGIFIATGGT